MLAKKNAPRGPTHSAWMLSTTCDAVVLDAWPRASWCAGLYSTLQQRPSALCHNHDHDWKAELCLNLKIASSLPPRWGSLRATPTPTPCPPSLMAQASMHSPLQRSAHRGGVRLSAARARRGIRPSAARRGARRECVLHTTRNCAYTHPIFTPCCRSHVTHGCTCLQQQPTVPLGVVTAIALIARYCVS
jgi:hypothetical protein